MWQGFYSVLVAPELARHFIEVLIDAGIDVATAAETAAPGKHGFGHAIMFPIARLMKTRKYPVVPVLLNTYYPPNQPTPRRCLEIGRALRRAVESYPSSIRVAIMASGGLSHMVTSGWRCAGANTSPAGTGIGMVLAAWS